MSTDRKTEGLAQPGVEAQYFTALGEGKLMIQHCGECRRAVFYPRQFCPHCDSEKLAWVQASGRGTVHAVTIVRTKPQGPYNVSLIDLDEGVRMMSRVRIGLSNAPSNPRRGSRGEPGRLGQRG